MPNSYSDVGFNPEQEKPFYITKGLFLYLLEQVPEKPGYLPIVLPTLLQTVM